MPRLSCEIVVLSYVLTKPSTGEIAPGLLRTGVLRSVKDLASQLAVAEADAGTSLSA